MDFVILGVLIALIYSLAIYLEVCLPTLRGVRLLGVENNSTEHPVLFHTSTIIGSLLLFPVIVPILLYKPWYQKFLGSMVNTFSQD